MVVSNVIIFVGPDRKQFAYGTHHLNESVPDAKFFKDAMGNHWWADLDNARDIICNDDFSAYSEAAASIFHGWIGTLIDASKLPAVTDIGLWNTFLGLKPSAVSLVRLVQGLLEAYAFGIRIVAPNFCCVVNELLVQGIDMLRDRKDIYRLAYYAFGGLIPVECPILQCLIDKHCCLPNCFFSNPQIDVDAAFMEELNPVFMRRAIESLMRTGSQDDREKLYRSRCYVEHYSVEVPRISEGDNHRKENECSKIHMKYDREHGVGLFDRED